MMRLTLRSVVVLALSLVLIWLMCTVLMLFSDVDQSSAASHPRSRRRTVSGSAKNDVQLQNDDYVHDPKQLNHQNKDYHPKSDAITTGPVIMMAKKSVESESLDVKHRREKASAFQTADNSNAQLGAPSSNLNDHRLCILVPFRDRFVELLAFVPYMSKFISSQNLPFVIVVLQQVDAYRFNRASLINVGYYESLRLNCDYMAMHDVDLVPINPELSYAYPAEYPVHLASPEYHPRYNYKTFIGGILLITLQQFARVNGMSNRYWGWGMEDDEFYVRLRTAGLLPFRPTGLTSNRSNTFMHMHSSIARPRDGERLGNQRNASRRLDRVSGVRNVNFTVSRRTQMSIENYPALVVNVQLGCNMTFSPWCIPSSLSHLFSTPNATAKS